MLKRYGLGEAQSELGADFTSLFPAKSRSPVDESVILAYSAGSPVETYARQLENALSWVLG